MKRTLLFLVFFANLLVGQQRPLFVRTPETLQPGESSILFSISYLHNQTFPLSGLSGDLYKLGSLHFVTALSSRVEFECEGTLLDVLSVKQRSPAYNSAITTSNTVTGDVGDFSFWSKIQLSNEYRSAFSSALRFGIQLPNTSNESGLGIDEMNFFAQLLFQKHLAGIMTLNIGFGIYSDPTELGSQHDVAIYAFGYQLPVSEQTFVELQSAGRYGHTGIGLYRLAASKFGITYQFDDFSFCGNFILNHAPTDNAKGVELGVEYHFPMIDPSTL